MTEAERGAYVATVVWNWLKNRQRIMFVPWVLDTKSSEYDPIKAAKQETQDKILKELEDVIVKASEQERRDGGS